MEKKEKHIYAFFTDGIKKMKNIFGKPVDGWGKKDENPINLTEIGF